MLPAGEIQVRERAAKPPKIRAALMRLQQLGVTVVDRHSDPALGYDYELRLPWTTKYPMAVLIEIGYLMAQLTNKPEEYVGFSASTGEVPRWTPSDGASQPLRFDVDPGYAYFRFDVSKDQK